MAKQVFGFGSKKVAQDLEAFIRGNGPSIGLTRMDKPKNSVGLWLMKATTDITAADFSVADPLPGFGNASVCYRDQEDGYVKQNLGTGDEILEAEVYNLTKRKISEGCFFFGVRDLAGTIWTMPVSVGGILLGRCGSGGVSTTTPTTVTLYDETESGYAIGTSTVEVLAFPTPVVGIADLAIWDFGCKLIAFKVC